MKINLIILVNLSIIGGGDYHVFYVHCSVLSVKCLLCVRLSLQLLLNWQQQPDSRQITDHVVQCSSCSRLAHSVNIEMVKHSQSCSDMFSLCRTKHETGRPRFVATRHVRQDFIIMVFQCVLLSYLMMQITFSGLSDDNSPARLIQYLS